MNLPDPLLIRSKDDVINNHYARSGTFRVLCQHSGAGPAPPEMEMWQFVMSLNRKGPIQHTYVGFRGTRKQGFAGTVTVVKGIHVCLGKTLKKEFVIQNR